MIERELGFDPALGLGHAQFIDDQVEIIGEIGVAAEVELHAAAHAAGEIEHIFND